MSYMFNLNTFGAQLLDFWAYIAYQSNTHVGSAWVQAFNTFLRFFLRFLVIVWSQFFRGVILINIMFNRVAIITTVTKNTVSKIVFYCIFNVHVL